ncbi:ATP-binding cassette domain-containing protein [Candidatus Woesearchaeota archaeon]|nr:ATP-binding cassette domain-containing protein [Candidatus Woesearchaeota archaeon]
MKKAVITLEEVWKTYTMGEVQVHALRGLSMEVYDKEFVAIMGPSGSGKSTCVNMVGVLDIPTKGRILLDGKDIASYEESDLAQIRGRKIGFVFQQFNLINTLTAKENVTLPMIFQNTSRKDRIERAEKILTKVGLGERMDHKPTEMSGGQQQRVAIARALANDPEIILADEPTGNLDSKTGKMVMDFLRSLNDDEKKTIIMVTHDQKLARYADRIICLKDGQAIKRMKSCKRRAKI